MDQLLVSHAGEQCHYGDLGVGSAQLLTGAQHWGLSTLEQEEHLAKQQTNSRKILAVVLQIVIK